MELDEIYNVVGIAFDRWWIDTLMKVFDRLGIDAYYDDGGDYPEGFRFVEWGQGYKDMAPAVDALDKAVAARTLRHFGHPILTWCFSNAVATLDPAGNRKLDKSKVRFRIDGAVAVTMALGLKARDRAEENTDLDDFINSLPSASATYGS